MDDPILRDEKGRPATATQMMLEKELREQRTIDYGVLDAAAKRCDGYLMQYGLEVTWQLHVLGLKLTAQWGADKFERYVSWQEFASANFDILERTEQAALAGLSS